MLAVGRLKLYITEPLLMGFVQFGELRWMPVLSEHGACAHTRGAAGGRQCLQARLSDGRGVPGLAAGTLLLGTSASTGTAKRLSYQRGIATRCRRLVGPALLSP